MKDKEKLDETATGGAIGGGGIAANPTPLFGGNASKTSFKRFLVTFKQEVKNRFQMKPVVAFHTITESVNYNDALSKLKGLEMRNFDVNDSTSYGIEDDDGNIMKVTVKKEQAEEFEEFLAQTLADKEKFNMDGYSGKDISMAELLYMLKSKFELVDVKFPKIPDNAIYNADKISYNEPNDLSAGNEMNPDMGGEDMGDMGEEGMPLGELPEEGEEGMGGEGEEIDMKDLADAEAGEEGLSDDESVEDFEEMGEEDNSPESLLKSVMSMLKADAEAKKAQAEAEAEKARAKQAEYTALATKHTISQQEQLMRLKAETEAQKKREKEAKEIADLAKTKAYSSYGLGESFESPLSQVILELDEYETEGTIRKQIALLRQKYAPNPNDPPEVKDYKRKMIGQSMRELQAKLQQARTRMQYYTKVKNREREMAKQNQQQNPNDQQNAEQPMGRDQRLPNAR
jgi:hypothetical protein